MENFSLSVLLTRDDYLADATRGARATPLSLLGLLMTAAGMLGWLFLPELPENLVFNLLLMGILLIAADWLLSAWLRRLNAAARYERCEELHQSMNLLFTAVAVSVSSARVEGTLPYTALTGTRETPALISLTFGNEATLRIPTRLLNTEQRTFLHSLCEKTTLSSYKRG